MTLPMIAGEFRMGTDPDLRYTPSGKAVCNFRVVASSRKQNERTQEWEDDKSTWQTCEVWEKHAENVAESLVKGDLVVIIGKAYGAEWTDNDNNKRTTPTIRVEHIGPALRFATAKVTKADRSSAGGLASGGGGGYTPPADDPWAAPAPPVSSTEPPF